MRFNASMPEPDSYCEIPKSSTCPLPCGHSHSIKCRKIYITTNTRLLFHAFYISTRMTRFCLMGPLLLSVVMRIWDEGLQTGFHVSHFKRWFYLFPVIIS